MTDLHNHTRFSPDSDAQPRDMVEAAIAKGAGFFGISEHMDYDYTPHPLEAVHEWGVSDIPAYWTEMESLKAEYAGRIRLLAGLEFGFNANADMQQFCELEQKYPWDYVINSVHTANGVECYWRENQKLFSQRELYTWYLTAIRNSLDAPYRYEIVGHIGYIVRNAPYADPLIHLSGFGELIDEIFTKMIEKDVSLELNTSANGRAAYLPQRELLERYRALGGEHISFGSDAHGPNRVLDGYPSVKRDAVELGFRYFDVFENRKRLKVLL